MTNLPLPNLDDRRWSDLVDEGRALIPLHAPNWTDHNVHDPGISILDLLAWITEMDIFAVNQITDAHRRKLVSLAGIRPHPPRPARTMLTVGLPAGAPPTELPVGVEFEGSDPFGASIPWRAEHSVVVQPGRLAAVLTGDGVRLSDLTASWERREDIQPFGPDPQPGATLYLGLDLPRPWPTATRVSIGLLMSDAHEDGGTTAAENPEHHSARLAWALMTSPGGWTELRQGLDVFDGTRSSTRDGRVTITSPAPTALGSIAWSPTLAWIRARLERGAFDSPPTVRGLALNAIMAVQSVPTALDLALADDAVVTGTPPDRGSWTGLEIGLDVNGDVQAVGFMSPDDTHPPVRVLEFNQAARRITMEAASVTQGTGAPSQHIDLPQPPVVRDSVVVVEHGSPRPEVWSARSDFDGSRRPDAHFVIEATSGAVTLGDGEHGRTARAHSTLVVQADRTAAENGNLAPDTINRLAASPHNRAILADFDALRTRFERISNIVAGAGGAAAEPVDSATARARDGRERATRAVTLDDFVELAKRTPGTRLARVEARANLHPGFPCLSAPGVVTVFLLPFLPVGRPSPSTGLRQAVRRHLEPLRVIGTRVEVVGPTYLTVSVRARVAAESDALPADVAAAVRQALVTFFDPLVGGPSATGWPIGRAVYRAEVLGLIERVAGVAHVVELELLADGQPLSCGSVCLGPTDLVGAGGHEIQMGDEHG